MTQGPREGHVHSSALYASEDAAPAAPSVPSYAQRWHCASPTLNLSAQVVCHWVKIGPAMHGGTAMWGGAARPLTQEKGLQILLHA